MDERGKGTSVDERGKGKVWTNEGRVKCGRTRGESLQELIIGMLPLMTWMF